jgi:hypothetical protein
MIKRGDGTTGHIVEAVDGDDKGMCIECGHLFPTAELNEQFGKCGACASDGGIVVKAQANSEEAKSCCGCGEMKADS